MTWFWLGLLSCMMAYCGLTIDRCEREIDKLEGRLKKLEDGTTPSKWPEAS